MEKICSNGESVTAEVRTTFNGQVHGRTQGADTLVFSESTGQASDKVVLTKSITYTDCRRGEKVLDCPGGGNAPPADVKLLGTVNLAFDYSEATGTFDFVPTLFATEGTIHAAKCDYDVGRCPGVEQWAPPPWQYQQKCLGRPTEQSCNPARSVLPGGSRDVARAADAWIPPVGRQTGAD